MQQKEAASRCGNQTIFENAVFMTCQMLQVASAQHSCDGYSSTSLTSEISTLAPSMVPMMRQPFIMNFMLPVPEASVPAVEICWDSSLPAATEQGTQIHPLSPRPGHLQSTVRLKYCWWPLHDDASNWVLSML